MGGSGTPLGDDWLSIAQAARRSGYTESGFRKLIEREEIVVAEDEKGRLRVPVHEVDALRFRRGPLSAAALEFEAQLERVEAARARAVLEAAQAKSALERREREFQVERRRLEDEASSLRLDVSRLRAALESVLSADASMRDALTHLVIEPGVRDWSR